MVKLNKKISLNEKNYPITGSSNYAAASFRSG